MKKKKKNIIGEWHYIDSRVIAFLEIGKTNFWVKICIDDVISEEGFYSKQGHFSGSNDRYFHYYNSNHVIDDLESTKVN